MIKTAQINVKSALEDFLKIEYTDGLNNEFNTMDSLINSLKKEKLVGLKRTKEFALGVTDNIRALGKSNDTYVLGVDDYSNAVETVSAEFDVTKLMGVFAITDEAILKGTTAGSIFNVVKDSLDRMKMNLKHTLNRYIYGSNTGLIGSATITETAVATTLNGKNVYKLEIPNSHSLLPGTGILIKIVTTTNDKTGWIQGKIWQKDNSTLHKDYVYVIETAVGGVNDDNGAKALGDPLEAGVMSVYARQLSNDGTVEAEYTGLEDIIMTQNNTLFGVNRSVYKSLNTTIVDLSQDPYDTADDAGGNAQANDGYGLLTEGVLRDLSDHISITANDDANIGLVASQPRIISTLEKQLYQFKEYSLDNNANGFKLGRPMIQFDQWQLKKDKFSRDRNVYLLDMNKIGEIQRKEFDWITSGRESVLERRDGTEIWEGIMTKYADMFVDSFRAHAAFKNAAMSLT